MALFSPDIVAYGDQAGMGLWINSHWYEHGQFWQLGLALTPPQRFPVYDLLGWSEDPEQVRAWLDAHAAVHEALRTFTGVGGIDLSQLSDDPGAFDQWMAYHAQEHATLRRVFGVN